MSERDVFIQNIPQIAELVMEIQSMTSEQRKEFKYDYLETIRNTNPKALEFMKKVLTVIEICLQKESTV